MPSRGFSEEYFFKSIIECEVLTANFGEKFKYFVEIYF